MSCKVTVGRAAPTQYEELMAALDRAFSFETDEEKFIGLLPKLYRAAYKPWKNNICVFENGRIAAAVGLYYSDFTVCGKVLHYGGIGNVAVLPEHRGKGYMKLAMNAAIEEMKQNGTDFCVLDGQRQRYRYFGFDNIGSCCCFHVTQRNLRHVFGASRKTDVTIEPLLPEDDAALDRIAQINVSRPAYAARQRDRLFDLLCSWFARPYKLMRGGRMIGYFVINREKNSVSEFAVETSADMASAVIAVSDFSGVESVSFTFPTIEHAYNDFFAEICEWIDHKGSCKISIYRYRSTVEAFLQARALETALPDQAFSCLIHGAAGDEKLMVTVRDGKPTVTDFDGDAQITLSHTQAAAFFFAKYSSCRRELPAAANGLLPVPFYLLSADHV